MTPPPTTLPACGAQPTCRLFVENQLCCQNEGLTTGSQDAVLRVLCNQPVNITSDCLSVGGLTSYGVVDTLQVSIGWSALDSLLFMNGMTTHASSVCPASEHLAACARPRHVTLLGVCTHPQARSC